MSFFLSAAFGGDFEIMNSQDIYDVMAQGRTSRYVGIIKQVVEHAKQEHENGCETAVKAQCKADNLSFDFTYSYATNSLTLTMVDLRPIDTNYTADDGKVKGTQSVTVISKAAEDENRSISLARGIHAGLYMLFKRVIPANLEKPAVLCIMCSKEKYIANLNEISIALVDGFFLSDDAKLTNAIAAGTKTPEYSRTFGEAVKEFFNTERNEKQKNEKQN